MTYAKVRRIYGWSVIWAHRNNGAEIPCMHVDAQSCVLTNPSPLSIYDGRKKKQWSIPSLSLLSGQGKKIHKLLSVSIFAFHCKGKVVNKTRKIQNLFYKKYIKTEKENKRKSAPSIFEPLPIYSSHQTPQNFLSLFLSPKQNNPFLSLEFMFV